MQSQHRLDRPARRRHWWRWVVAGVLAVIVIAAVAARIFIGQQRAPAPLRLPTAAAPAPAGSLTGTWLVSTGSVAGFRITQSAFGASSTVAGRTTAVTGGLVATGSEVVSAAFHVDLAAITVNGKSQPALASSLKTKTHPEAEITLSRPVELTPAFASGASIRAVAPGMLTLNGTARPVTITLDARRDGPAIEVAGWMPVTLAAWHISRPAGVGWFGSLADHGTAEFLLVLRSG